MAEPQPIEVVRHTYRRSRKFMFGLIRRGLVQKIKFEGDPKTYVDPDEVARVLKTPKAPKEKG